METEFERLCRQAAKAMQEAADHVVEEARRTNGMVVVWEDGAVRHIPADQLPTTKPLPPECPHPNPLPVGEGTDAAPPSPEPGPDATPPSP
jgi:hypothetical protein